ncbi:ribonuclease III [Mycoplasma sp. 744]|uniref:ribonuclease III n=1 Tax=unclassified Mycoplasma TaxID=2683645 RepID=UPI00211BD0BE|nr:MULTISPECIES: ribonuclease III [unclassified Mycoplasma]MEA4115287.1 ribonuclease III [Mycoplasma sp. 744]UUM19290.1 ribonuclease III [Mycoplasma sp. 1018B]
MINQDKFNEFLKKYNIEIKNFNYFQEALTHNSYIKFQAKNKNIKNYQTLEFLGDSILQFLVSVFLYKNHNELEQGKLTLLRSKMVNTKNLNELSHELKLLDFLLTASGKMSIEVKKSEKVGADIFESLVGAIFLDQGLEKTINFLKQTLFPTVNKFNVENLKDFKSQLQEYMQSFSKKTVNYQTISINNDHFEAKAIHNNNTYGVGIGKNKLEAEENAAKNALEKLKK